MAERLRGTVESILRSYSQIFFSRSPLLGVCVALTTFVSPAHGLTGFCAALLANLFAWWLGMDRITIREGGFGFNAVLVGLAMGARFEWSWEFSAFLILLCALVVPTTAMLNGICISWFGVPALSLPFNLITWLAVAASFEIGKLAPIVNRWSLGWPFETHAGLAYFFINLGAILFQGSPLAGLILAVGLILYSRIAFVLVTLGYAVAYGAQGFFGLDPSWLEVRHLGFNPMLTALAVGGVFVVPSAGGIMLAGLAAVLSMLLLMALGMCLPVEFSPLALPFNLTVILLVHALRLRVHGNAGVALAPPGQLSPEALRLRSRKNSEFFRTPLFLPFFGKWKVTQGVDGRYTHQGVWRFAYDFQAVDSEGRIFKNGGSYLEDYHAYGRPVLACADGEVSWVADHIADNPVGSVNLAQNWGNTVIIRHAPDFYSCSSHLKPASIAVKPGQQVKKGQVIAFCGNSGRSPYPHLHFQLQARPELGAATVAFEFGEFKTASTGDRLIGRGLLQEGEVVFAASPPTAKPLDQDRALELQVNRG